MWFRFGLGYFLLLGSGSVRFLATPGCWSGSFLLDSASFPSLIETVQRKKLHLTRGGNHKLERTFCPRTE